MRRLLRPKTTALGLRTHELKSQHSNCYGEWFFVHRQVGPCSGRPCHSETVGSSRAFADKTKMEAAESKTPPERQSRTVGRFLRNIRIGPRLLLSILIAPLALLVLIGLMTSSDVQSLQELREFSSATNEVSAQIEVRVALQVERHSYDQNSFAIAEAGEVNAEALEDLSMTQDAIDQALRDLGFVGGSAFLEDLQQARQLAETNQAAQAALIYTDLINELGDDIAATLRAAPFGVAGQRGTGLQALLNGEELLLLEDLETREAQINPIRLNELHTSALAALTTFSENGSPTGVATLEQITVSDFWRTLNLVRLDSFDAPRITGQFDRVAWQPAALLRSTALGTLVSEETERLQSDVQAVVDDETQRLVLLAIIALVVVALAMFIAFWLRRSIVAPLATLTLNARLLARGEPAPTQDSAPDEIGEMSQAFASISSTIEHLWNDVGDVSEAVAAGEYDKRIATEQLSGDWLRLAETMNDTLATGEEHRSNELEELDRRGTMEQISNAAALATTARATTAAVLGHLPSALPGSRSHLFRHPSGPPTVDLGVELEDGFSALELPTIADTGQLVQLRGGSGIASLVEFPEGPPAVLVLQFGQQQPSQIEPLISLVENASKILAQAHRRFAAETRALHDREHDLTTDLPNSEFARHWFTERADRSMPWSIIGIQPQRLDELDGLLGRSSGDLLMKSIAEALDEVIDDVVQELVTDSNFEVVLTRVTKPEFAVIAPTAIRDRLTTAFAERFSQPLVVHGAEIELGATIAYAAVSLSDRDLTQTITNVLAAVGQGSGREVEIIAFEEEHRESLRRRSIIVDWLSRAIDDQDLSAHFQPIVNAMTTATEGYEVLVRGTMDGHPLSPGEFIPIAEDTGMITAIGKFVLREAVAALPFLRGTNPYVAVNLSPVQLSNVDLLTDIDRILSGANAPRDRVIFEVTEGATATPEGLARLEELRGLGVKIAIDDFGSGQSNLSYLNELPAQILKLDRSLVTPMIHDPGATTLVEKAIEMAHALDMTVIGEGVETLDELNALRRVHCDRIQGWFTGKPGPLEDFIEISVAREPAHEPSADQQ